MTTACSASSVAGVLALGCLLSASAWAKGPDAHQLRLCPELKTARGRARTQLRALFFKLHPKRLTAKARPRVRALFDLRRQGDVALLARYLDASDRVACLNGLRTVFRAHGDAGLVWLLERYARAKPTRRARLLTLLADFDRREVWRLFEKLLADRTVLPDPGGRRVAPPGFRDLRVCDHALRALTLKLGRVRALEFAGSRADRTVHALLAIKLRDARVARFARTLRAHRGYRKHVRGRASIPSRRLARRARVAIRKLSR